MSELGLKHFYIAEEQSIYLLSSQDAKKLRDWVELCKSQLKKLGYRDIEMIGKGAYGFCFSGKTQDDRELVFKFARITLAQHIRERLEDESFMLSQVHHPLVPAQVEYQRRGKQFILVMERAKGEDFDSYCLKHGALSAPQVVHVASQLAGILKFLRQHHHAKQHKPIVHGDIKPSNVVFNPETDEIGLIDWGSSVYAQIHEDGNYVNNNVMDLMSSDLQHTNARLGDVYFIGEDQLNGGLSSPRFDEQGVAATLYALASSQSCRYGYRVITPLSLGLPVELARTIESMMDPDADVRAKAGDYFIANIGRIEKAYMPELPSPEQVPSIPIWTQYGKATSVESVVYSSRRSFLRAQQVKENVYHVDDAQLDKYYKNFLQGMGDTEKAFIAAVSRLGRFPLVGGLAISWKRDGVYIDANFILFDESYRRSLIESINNMVNLSRGIYREGVFKSCLFDARNTIHVERNDESQPFITSADEVISYEISDVPEIADETRVHSYFEDGEDPDELLQLPPRILQYLTELNEIHHTGCIIFEALPKHLKLHSYFRLLDHSKESEFASLLAKILEAVVDIKGIGISGYMKLPYKGTRFFDHIDTLPEKFYPRNPKRQEELIQ